MQMNYPRYCRYKNPIVLIIIYLSFFNLRDILEWENGKKKLYYLQYWNIKWLTQFGEGSIV